MVFVPNTEPFSKVLLRTREKLDLIMQGAKKIAKMNSLNLHHTLFKEQPVWAKDDSVTACQSSV